MSRPADAPGGVRLVLSTGRTGSTLLREYLKALPLPLDVAFEPYPSRRSYVLWNAAEAGLLSRAAVHADFRRVRGRAWQAVADGQLRLELHAYLAPMITEIITDYRPLRLVHLVRHPLTWITSIARFKAAGWRRDWVDRLPFTRHVHPEARAGWRQLGEYERNAWRWRRTNEAILAASGAAEAAALVRYEDLVAADAATARVALQQVLAVLLQPMPVPDVPLARDARPNASRADGLVPDWQAWPGPELARVQAICAPLLGPLGYGPTPP